jgi:hypothetical protein
MHHDTALDCALGRVDPWGPAKEPAQTMGWGLIHDPWFGSKIILPIAPTHDPFGPVGKRGVNHMISLELEPPLLAPSALTSNFRRLHYNSPDSLFPFAKSSAPS